MQRDDEKSCSRGGPSSASWRLQAGRRSEAFSSPVVYLPFRQGAPRTASLLVRSNLPTGSVMTAVRSTVQPIDPDQPVFNIQTIAAVFANERSIYRIFATLFGVLAAIGLLLSAIGVYGVIAYSVTQRTQEIGVRMAIGAGRWDVSWMFLRRGLTQLGIALAIGLPGAIAIGIVAHEAGRSRGRIRSRCSRHHRPDDRLVSRLPLARAQSGTRRSDYRAAIGMMRIRFNSDASRTPPSDRRSSITVMWRR